MNEGLNISEEPSLEKDKVKKDEDVVEKAQVFDRKDSNNLHLMFGISFSEINKFQTLQSFPKKGDIVYVPKRPGMNDRGIGEFVPVEVIEYSEVDDGTRNSTFKAKGYEAGGRFRWDKDLFEKK